ncbi:MAG: hypothetical protein A2X49_16750 [Lentisphaerae bacterium GWF2_52_8]|nr:MAG: hypothetical protein A2X49_16750 [Lentisphaerae bacterium GWF2_52_8]
MLRFSEEENNVQAGESQDPIGDRLHGCCANGRLIHRYPDRALLLVTDQCAAHCRFCFRRRKGELYKSEISGEEFAEALDYISSDAKIREVILSGGDPLSLSDGRLLEILDGLRSVSPPRQIAIRLHTRYPVYDPSRCESFSGLASRFDTIVLHVNHSRELSPAFSKAVAVLQKSPLLLNQSTLLKGVNDSVEELAALSRGLLSNGIRPYYLHYPDLAEGISHFRIPVKNALRLISSLRGILPEHMIPKLVLDLPGGNGKIILTENSLDMQPDGSYLFKSPLNGKPVIYHEPHCG